MVLTALTKHEIESIFWPKCIEIFDVSLEGVLISLRCPPAKEIRSLPLLHPAGKNWNWLILLWCHFANLFGVVCAICDLVVVFFQ